MNISRPSLSRDRIDRAVTAMIGVLLLAYSAALAQDLRPQGDSTSSQQASAPGPAAAATQPGMGGTLSAEGVLAGMRRVYADCKSYQDEGMVTESLSGRSNFTSKLPFKTWFVRPDQFRFEFRQQSGPGFGPWQRYVVCASGQQVHSYWTVENKIDTFDSIESALGGPTGISGGSATVIPTLLLPSMHWGNWARTVQEAKLRGTEAVAGATCYKLECSFSGTDPRTLWIDARTFLVRRVFEKDDLSGTVVESTTEYTPQLDVEIPKDVFEFDLSKGDGNEPQPPL